MQKRRLYLLLIGIGVAGVLVAVFSREREPEYGGKRLSEWVEEHGPLCGVGCEFNEVVIPRETREAIHDIGVKALPYLLKWARYDAPTWKTKLYDAVNLTLAKFNRNWWIRDRQEIRAAGAIDLLRVLGTEARGAVPELTRMLDGGKPTVNAIRAVQALPYLGKDALAPLLGVLTNQQAGTLRSLAAQSMITLGTNALPAVSILIQCVRDSDESVAITSVLTLCKLNLEAGVALPVLLGSLEDARTSVRGIAVFFLRNLGPEARNAVPGLLKLLEHHASGTREAATDALQAIDPQALEKAGKNGE